MPKRARSLRQGDIARLTTDVYLSGLEPAMKPSDAYACIARRQTERVEIDQLEGRITTSLLTPYPPGIPLLIPGERFNKKIVDFLKFAATSTPPSQALPPTCMAWWPKAARRWRALLRGLCEERGVIQYGALKPFRLA